MIPVENYDLKLIWAASKLLTWFVLRRYITCPHLFVSLLLYTMKIENCDDNDQGICAKKKKKLNKNSTYGNTSFSCNGVYLTDQADLIVYEREEINLTVLFVSYNSHKSYRDPAPEVHRIFTFLHLSSYFVSMGNPNCFS